MTAQFARAPHVSGRPAPPVYNAPHAALLIDFDNVTMGIRSDLTKELKSLLNSDIIKGKVAVQRAYADWRRYPQYIVPLAENSVDLIFAPAYGSSKKNATDIRLSIDALELVFTRPEIGTFILLSGDSDFSSLVLKLKEYGKYVIGVGIRESASDLLVQNCDEYYSYSALTGLTRAGDEELQELDPWECVEIAVQRMAEHNDVMRSDRLKQVILELDPNFDEKALGFTKFNRFIQEAANRGLLELTKLENGQFEVGPIGTASGTGAVAEAGAGSTGAGAVLTSAGSEDAEERRPSRRERQRDRGRDRPRRDREPVAAPVEPVPEPARAQAEPEPARAQTAPAESAPAPAKPAPASAPAPAPEAGPMTLEGAYDLLRTATLDVTQGKGAARDSDVKRRILELNPDWSEPALGFSKFSRFLRQAHDAEVINLRKLENGNYEIAVPGRAEPEPESSGRGRGRGRGRGQEEGRGRGRGRGRDEGRGREEGRRPRREEQPQLELSTSDTAAPAPEKPAAGKPAAAKPAPAESAPAPAKPAPASAPAPAPASAGSLRGRVHRKGSVPSGPPPLLPGQMVGPAAAKAEPKPAPKAEEAKPAKVDSEQVLSQLVAIKGVGRKTAEAAVEAFGADKIFDVLRNEPERVKETLGARRAQPLIDGAASSEKPSANGKQKKPAATKKRAATKSGRGGTKRGRSRSGAAKS